ncbi:hypothetical protein [Streptomyces decoyicus]|uniref:hypothetical protein n=1 Tax=Streptomyces decoyicus TaxID=249567 RepID=UPI00365D40F5
MSSGHKTMTAFLTVLGALILAIVGLLTSWPLWAWPLSTVLLPVGTLLIGRALAPGRVTGTVYLPPEDLAPIPPVYRQELTVVDVALPSAADDYDFSFSATVKWDVLDSPADAPHVSPGGLAIEAIMERARAITGLESPQRSALLQHRLNGALGIMMPDDTGRVRAMAEQVSLSLPPRDQERLDKLARVRKDEEVWKHERKYELDRRGYLGDDVLKDPGSAVVWWLAKNDDHVEKTVEHIGLLAQLASAANNSEVPEEFRHYLGEEPVPEPVPAGPVAQAYVPAQSGAHPLNGASPGEYLNGLLHAAGVSHGDTSDVARRIAAVLEANGKLDAGESIRQRFGPASAASTAPDVSPSAPDRHSEGPDADS